MESNIEMNITTDGLTENEKMWAALAYFFGFIGAVLAMTMEDSKKSPYVQLHVNQALAEHVVFLVINMLTCGAATIVYIPLVIWHAYQAYQGSLFDIPVITPYLLKSDFNKRVKELL
jgi:uncharacterized membrane protein